MRILPYSIYLADIGRSTFYLHFDTKDKLRKALCTEIFDHVFCEEFDQENTHDFSLMSFMTSFFLPVFGSGAISSVKQT